jgi:hypothetical protein
VIIIFSSPDRDPRRADYHAGRRRAHGWLVSRLVAGKQTGGW